MGLLIVSAAASPLFKDFLFVVSVSDTGGAPVTGLICGMRSLRGARRPVTPRFAHQQEGTTEGNGGAPLGLRP